MPGWHARVSRPPTSSPWSSSPGQTPISSWAASLGLGGSRFRFNLHPGDELRGEYGMHRLHAGPQNTG